MLSAADGSQPRTLAERKYPNQFGAAPGTRPAWSSTGQLIAAPVRDGPTDFSIVLVDTRDGSMTVLASRRWAAVFATDWLPDGSGLLASGREAQSALLQIWRVDYPGGEIRQITSGLDSYTGVSVSRDGQKLVSTAGTPEATLWLASPGDQSDPTQITTGAVERDGGSGLAWTADDQIVYSSLASGNADIWSINPESGARRQLTSSPGSDMAPAVSPDGRLIAFESVRGAERRIWVMDSNGGNQRAVSAGPN